MAGIRLAVDYPGLSQDIKGMRYTLSTGTMPDMVTFDINPLSQLEMSRVPAVGNLVFQEEGKRFVVPNCQYHSSNTFVSDHGMVQRLRFMDRRWEWAYGVVSGAWQGIQTTLQQVLAALGETAVFSPEVVGLQLKTRQVTFAYAAERPADVLEQLADEYGLVIYPQVSTGSLARITLVGRQGYGTFPTPNDDTTVIQSSLSVDRRPGYITLIGEPDQYRQAFEMVPVLSYTDTDGETVWVEWSTHPEWDDNAVGLQPGSHSVKGYPTSFDSEYCRVFAIADCIDREDLGTYEELTSEQFAEVFERAVITQVEDIIGTHVANSATVSADEYEDRVKKPFDTDSYRTAWLKDEATGERRPALLVRFNDPIVFHQTPQRQLAVPPELWAYCTYNVLLKNGQLNRMYYDDKTGAPNQYRIPARVSGLIRRVQGQFTYLTPEGKVNRNDRGALQIKLGDAKATSELYFGNRNVFTNDLRYLIDKIAANRFGQPQQRYTLRYRGLQQIPLTGTTTQITWQVSTSEAPSTTVYVNWEGDPYALKRQERRQLQRQRQVAVSVWGDQS